MSAGDGRPVRVMVDCTAREVTRTPVTDQEWAEQKAGIEAAAAQALERAAANERLRAAAAAHPDPVVRELARLAGLA